MLFIILITAVLVAVTVAVHAAGYALLLQSFMNPRATMPRRFWPISLRLIQVTWLLVLIHAAAITIWALFYLWAGFMPDVESAFYFSGATYTTIGYGDVVLPKPWRILGPIEGLTGILMCGLSASFFFALANRIYRSRWEGKPE